jgi:hypothetical protein
MSATLNNSSIAMPERRRVVDGQVTGGPGPSGPTAAPDSPRLDAVIYAFGMVATVSPMSMENAAALPEAVLRRFEVINDGGTLIRVEDCVDVDAIGETIRWLDAVGVQVHRIVELPTDPASPAHNLADAVNSRLGLPHRRTRRCSAAGTEQRRDGWR